jgi:hypothetical protein
MLRLTLQAAIALPRGTHLSTICDDPFELDRHIWNCYSGLYVRTLPPDSFPEHDEPAAFTILWARSDTDVLTVARLADCVEPAPTIWPEPSPTLVPVARWEYKALRMEFIRRHGTALESANYRVMKDGSFAFSELSDDHGLTCYFDRPNPKPADHPIAVGWALN